jgi:hypothetical protein
MLESTVGIGREPARHRSIIDAVIGDGDVQQPVEDSPATPPAGSGRLRPDGLTSPRLDRFDPAGPGHGPAMEAHAEAVEARLPGYIDPGTGLFVMTAVYLAERTWCCGRGCRHCPYEEGA